jgi:hypothetical protein
VETMCAKLGEMVNDRRACKAGFTFGSTWLKCYDSEAKPSLGRSLKLRLDVLEDMQCICRWFKTSASFYS